MAIESTSIKPVVAQSTSIKPTIKWSHHIIVAVINYKRNFSLSSLPPPTGRLTLSGIYFIAELIIGGANCPKPYL